MSRYFAAAIPLMVLVVILYLFIKSSLSNRRDNPLQRGAYEEIYYEFATEYPELWSRAGPRTYVVPTGFFSKLRWRIVKSWFLPSKTISRRNISELEEMGLWARIKRRLAQRWLGQIKLAPGSGDMEMGLLGADGEFSTVNELLQTSTPEAMAVGDPTIAMRMGSPPFRRFSPRGRGRSRSSSGGRSNRPNSLGSEMVVEEEKSEDEGSAGGKEKVKVKTTVTKEVSESRSSSPVRKGARRTVSEERRIRGGLLNVPLSIRRGDEHAP